MKVLSIDVGIKNLAFCLFEDNTIDKWDVVNISEQVTLYCMETEKGGQCNKQAVYTKDGKCFCLKHSKKQSFQIPSADLKPAYINKQKIQQLYELADKYSVQYDKPIKKCDLIKLLEDYISNTCFQPISSVNASKVDLISIGKNIKYRLDEIFPVSDIDTVIIENQISPIANRMKTIQGMIAQYFIMKKSFQHIEFVSSINKLKGLKKGDGETPTYGDRKKLGIAKCLELLESQENGKLWKEYFLSHKKKDDLADSFLQGMWYITK